jgi:hypothetical protein
MRWRLLETAPPACVHHLVNGLGRLELLSRDSQSDCVLCCVLRRHVRTLGDCALRFHALRRSGRILLLKEMIVIIDSNGMLLLKE